MTESFIQVKNLEKHQPSYKDGRNIIWMRWDLNSHRDYKIHRLSTDAKWLFLVLVCLAVENKNMVPADVAWLSKESGIEKSRINKSLLMLQALELIVTSCNNENQNLCPTDIHTDRHTNIQGACNEPLNVPVTEQEDSRFMSVWCNYPKPVGKKDALRHFVATVKTDADFEDIKKALANYALSDEVRKGFVKNGSTWFNQWRDWVNFDGKSPVNEKDRIRAQFGLKKE